MTKPIEPAQDNSGNNWQAEVNWPRVRLLIFLHGVYWAFGAIQFALLKVGLLEGMTRTFIGLLDYVFWAILLVMLFPIVSRVRHTQGSNQCVSVPTFLILIAFMGSLFGFILLLSFIGLDTVTLFSNP